MKYLKTKVFCTMLCLTGFLYWQNNGLILTELEYSQNVPAGLDGYKILQVADLQNKTFAKQNQALLRSMQKTAPNIIVITGDLLDRNKTDVDAAMAFINSAITVAPIYFVTGNHEHQSGEWETLSAQLTAAGVTILNNKKTSVMHNGDTLTLMGLTDKRANPDYERVLSTLTADCEDAAFQVLLSHRPELFDTYVNSGIHLAFTGHAHGGQIRLPFVGGIFAPNQGFFPEYTSGLYQEGNTAMVVSRGLGNSVFPFRIFNRPELVLVQLKYENVV